MNIKIKRYNLVRTALITLTLASIGIKSKAADGESAATYTQTELSSFYLTGFGGVNWTGDFSASGSDLNIETELDAGYVVGGGIGYFTPWAGGLRLEIEGTYRSNHVDQVRTNGKLNQGEGELSAWSAMFNIAKDFKITDRLSFYAGGGVGLAGVDADFRYGKSRINGKDEVFAWKVFSGISYEVVSNFELYTEYRFFRAEAPELSRSKGGASQPVGWRII